DPPPRAALAAPVDDQPRRGRGGAPLRGDARDAARVDRAPPPRGGGGLPGEGDRVPRRHGGPWPPPPALPRLRRPRAAHRARGEREQLLRALSDGRAPSRRPGPLAAPEGGLAAHARRDGGAPAGRVS